MGLLIGYSDLIVLGGAVGTNIATLIEHGAESIEILMDGPEWDEQIVPSTKHILELNRFEVGYSVHPPPWDTNLTSENGAIRELSFLQCQRSILLAAEIGASYVVIHPGFQNAPVFSRKIAQQRAADALDRLNRIARPRGVKLAVENVGYQGTSIFTMNEFSNFLDPMDDNVGYLIDTGHAFIDHWDIPRLIRTVQDRLLAVHLHDNSGSFDQHLAIGAGSIPWEPIWDSVRSTEMRFQLVLEYDAGHSLERMREDKNMLARRLAFRAPSGD